MTRFYSNHQLCAQEWQVISLTAAFRSQKGISHEYNLISMFLSVHIYESKCIHGKYIYICTYIHFYVTAWKGFTLLEVWWREWRNRGDGEGCRSRIGREWREAIGNWQVEWNEKPSWWKGDTRMNRGGESNREFGMKGACKRGKKPEYFALSTFAR